jgi:integrase/recombinase XerD
MADDLSRARGGWAGPIDALLSFLGLERGLSANTLAAYRRDLDQAAAFLARHGAADWGVVTGDHAAAWLQYLAAGDYAVASVARKLSALRMLARVATRTMPSTSGQMRL